MPFSAVIVIFKKKLKESHTLMLDKMKLFSVQLSTEFFIIYYLSVFLIWYILLYLSLCREMCKGCELVTHFSLYIYILHAR